MHFRQWKRREFITLLGGAAAAWPLAAHAQEPGRIYRLGVLSQTGRQTPQMLAFFDELRLSGLVEGHNIAVAADGFDVPIKELDARAAAMVKVVPDVLMGIGDLATRALKEATQTVPIVGAAEDMVEAGLVASLSRPGGNVTGIEHALPRTRRKAAGYSDRGGAERAPDRSVGRWNANTAVTYQEVAGTWRGRAASSFRFSLLPGPRR